jgi:hypothetical protein
MSPEMTIVLYALTSALEIYLFLMQRASLEMSRAGQVDPKIGRHMLPLWYVIVWPNKFFRWFLLYGIWAAYGWFAVISAWAVVAVATTLMPVPFGHFLPVFQRKVSRNIADFANGESVPGAAEINIILISLLSAVENKLKSNGKR